MERISTRLPAAVALCLAAVLPAGAQTATPVDSIRAYQLGEVVVTASRSRAPLVSSTASVSVLTGEELRQLPVRSVAEALERVPGFAILDVEGTGGDPQVTVRGFYGGGEAEYVVVLLNGRPLNGAEAGLVNWDLIPLAAVERIEVVRGGASSLYGDAAVGGVINIITHSGLPHGFRGRLSGGAHGRVEGSAALDTQVGGRVLSLFANARRADGFRENAEAASTSAGGTIDLVNGGGRTLRISALGHWRDRQEPGPVEGGALREGRLRSAPFYRFDAAEERLGRVALDAGAEFGSETRISGFVLGEIRGAETVRTLPLAPDFADTKARQLDGRRLLTSVQAEQGGLPLAGRVVVGVDGALDWLDSEYRAVASGGPEAYESGSGEAGEIDARGAGRRISLGAFAALDLHPADAVGISLGGRLDWLRDRFVPRRPGDAQESEAEHLAFSPKLGVNVRWLRTAAQEGHLYANVGRSFKAPTPDQLFDQRSIPVPFPPYRVAFSNAELNPQYGRSAEAGLYHHAMLVPGILQADVSLAAYQIDMRDELDFDLETFRYVNLGRSRHRGVEAGLRLRGPAGVGVFANYTLQSVTLRNGEYEGNRVKAIPEHFWSGGVSAGAPTGLAGSIVLSAARGIWLDDANTVELPGYTRLDGRASYPLGGLRLSLEVFNLLDRAYSTTGFPDPAGTGAIYYYPAAGRTLQIGLSTGW